MEPRFERTDDRQGFAVVDPIQRRRFPVETADPVSPTPVDAAEFRFPVENAVAVTTAGFTLPYVVTVTVRDGDGDQLGVVENDALEQYPDGSYTLELHAPVKLYLRVDGPIRVTAAGDATHLGFDDGARVRIGARSYHERPEATVTTTDDPADLLAAVSLFGSALKTLSPERSFPTLRGHPPAVELGEEFDAPEHLDRPDTGIRIVVPPETEYVFAAAPLAYYLGAAVVPGRQSRIETDEGFVRELGEGRAFEASVAEVLQQTFLLDCVTRTEGYYPVPLHERAVVEERLDLDFAALYDRPIAARLAAYLDVPFDAIADQVPTWPVVADVRPDVENVEMLPFVVDDLGIVRDPDLGQPTPNPAVQAEIESFVRGDDPAPAPEPSPDSEPGEPDVQPPGSDALEQVWVGSGRPYGAGKLLADGFRNRFAAPERSAEIDITVVCNDPEMRREFEEGGLYGSRAELPYEIAVHEEVTAAELRSLLGRPCDFFHYIGHIEGTSFVCADGGLDVRDLDSVGPRAFLLNGCQSYEQGKRMVALGSVAGIVTLDDVGNAGAVDVGQLVARLLDRGFSMQSALVVAKEHHVVGHQYVAVGATRSEIVQSESGTPNYCEIERETADAFGLRIRTFPTTQHGIGALYTPYLDEVTEYHLRSGTLPRWSGVSRESLQRFLAKESVPLFFEDELHWSTEFELPADGP